MADPPAHSGSYHHGNLRRALIEAGRELLREGGPEALTLRAAARRAEVSRTAPYRHFKDRRALVAAVVEESFSRLGKAISDDAANGEPGLPALRRGMLAYVRFAHEHPAEYRVMFGPELASSGESRALDETSFGVFELLRGAVARLQEAGQIGEGDPSLMAISTWATLHGLVMLSLDGRTSVTGRSIESLAESATALLLRGMVPTGR